MYIKQISVQHLGRTFSLGTTWGLGVVVGGWGLEAVVGGGGCGRGMGVVVGVG